MSVNKVILVGRLGRDPETRFFGNNEPVCNFSIATDESWKDKNGERQQRTEWHNIVMYRRLAEIAQQYLKKGSMVYIEGRIQSRKYLGKDNIERTAYDIVADEMKMLGGRNDTSGDSGYSPFPEESSPAPSSAKVPELNRNVAGENVGKMEDLADDIPF